MATITRGWMGQGNDIRAAYSLGGRLAGWIDITYTLSEGNKIAN